MNTTTTAIYRPSKTTKKLPAPKFDLPEGIIIEYKRKRSKLKIEEVSPLMGNFSIYKKTWHKGRATGVVIAIPIANDYFAFGWHALHPDDAAQGIEFDRYFALRQALERAQAGTPLDFVPFPLRNTLLHTYYRVSAVEFNGRKLIDIQADSLEEVSE